MTLNEVVERVSEGRNLLANLALIKPETWEDSVQVFNAKDFGVVTANMGIYDLVLDSDDVEFNLLGKEGNLFIDDRFREKVYNGIVTNEFFVLPDDMKIHVKYAIDAESSVRVRYSGLRLKTENCNPKYGYVEVSDDNTPTEKTLIKGVYGIENPGNGKKIFLLRKSVVKAQLENRKNDLIARACYFDIDLNFDADVRDIDSYISAVRGVRRVEIAEGDAEKVDNVIITEEQAVQYFTQHPVSTDAGAKVLAQASNAFYQSKLNK